jgi:hypothetical protein
MSMSYIWAATDRRTVPLSCHCQLVFGAGAQQLGQATGAGSACGVDGAGAEDRAAAGPAGAASRQAAASNAVASGRILKW